MKLETPIARTLPVLEQLHEPSPRVHVSILLRVGPVDQEQIDAIEAETLGAVGERLLRLLEAVPPLVELRRDEDLVAVDTARPDPPPDACLVAVVLGGVDQPVADVDRGDDGRLGLAVAHRRRPEAEGGHGDTVRERDGRNLAHLAPRPMAPDASGRSSGRRNRCGDRPGARPDAFVELLDGSQHEIGFLETVGHT